MKFEELALFQLFEIAIQPEPSVIGRCLCGIIRNDSVVVGLSPNEHQMRPIDTLQITGIEIYRRRVPEIEEGLTARLFLSCLNSGFKKDAVLWVAPKTAVD
jgi:hypothetical protein